MNLHHDKDAFEELLIGAANELMIPTNISYRNSKPETAGR